VIIINKKKTKIANINLQENEFIEENKLFLKHINKISEKLELDKNILIFYIFNNGKIENIIEGLKIEEISKYKYKLKISETIKIKKNIIKENILYNFTHYFILNKFEKSYYNHKNFRDIYNYNDTLFKRKIKIDFLFEGVEPALKVNYNKENDIVEKGFSLEWLKDNDKESFEDLEEYVEYILPEGVDEEYHYVPLIITTLTSSLDKNMQIIDSSIKNNYKWYIEELERIKKHNRKYFKKQLIQKNIKNF
jgi:hypothetical protein